MQFQAVTCVLLLVLSCSLATATTAEVPLANDPLPIYIGRYVGSESPWFAAGNYTAPPHGCEIDQVRGGAELTRQKCQHLSSGSSATGQHPTTTWRPFPHRR